MRISFPVVLAVMTILFQTMPSYSQRFLFGVKVAGQITDTFTYPALPQVVHEDRILFGPMVEMRLARRLSVEGDVLYKRNLDTTDPFVTIGPPVTLQGIDNQRAHSWEIPVLLKWRPAVHGKNSLFVAGGFSSRNVAGIDEIHGTASAFPPNASGPFDTRTPVGDWTYGPVIGAGIDISVGTFHFQPEVRYMRWNASPFAYVTKPDDVQALIGFAFGKR